MCLAIQLSAILMQLSTHDVQSHLPMQENRASMHEGICFVVDAEALIGTLETCLSRHLGLPYNIVKYSFDALC